MMLAAEALTRMRSCLAEGRAVDVAREDIWGFLQAAAKPELRKVFAAARMRPCWMDTGGQPAPL